jgi:HSP20 family protein
MLETIATESPRSRRPLRVLRDEAEDLFSRFVRGVEDAYSMGRVFPPYDLSEAEDVLEIRVDLPGVPRDQIDIRMRGDTLIINGERQEDRQEKGRIFHHQDRRMGNFALTIPLPYPVDDTRAAAECRDGVLTVSFPSRPKSALTRSKSRPD